MKTLRHLLMMLLLLVASTAQAQDAATAEQLFAEGKKLLDKGSYDEACKKLRASLEADASGGAALNLGRCNEERAKPATAWANYEQAVALFHAKGDTEREKFAQERADALKPTLPHLTIEAADTPGLVVTRNGDTVAAGALGSAVPLDPGDYTIEATAAGYQSWSKSVSILAGKSQNVSIPALQISAEDQDGGAVGPEPDAPSGDGPNALVITGGVLIGLGGASVIVGAIMGGMVLSGSSDAENDPALCGDKTCTPAGREEIDSLEGKALAADLLLGIGGGVAAAGVVLLIIGSMDDSSAEGDVALFPSASHDGATLQVIGRF